MQLPNAGSFSEVIIKTIGLIGGMSWASSIEYYRFINQEVNRRLGGQHNAKSLMMTVDFAEIEALQVSGDWDQLGEIMADAARRLERGGADCVLICANTMHRCVPQIEAAVRIPLIHIADATADAIRQAKLRTVGLLGTRYTMEGDFFRGRLAEKHGITALIPPAEMRDELHRLIYDELTKGIFKDSSRRCFVQAIEWLQAQGVEGVILGCTEIPLLVKAEHASIPLFDTTAIHANAAVGFALGSH
jgi:aspartate racemase